MQTDYVRHVRQAAVHMRALSRSLSQAGQVAVKVLKLTMPRDYEISDETCRQAGLLFVAEALKKADDAFDRDILNEFRDILSFGSFAPNNGQFSEKIVFSQ